MECAARGRGGRCVGPATRRCARCGAVAYCSLSHQISHWSVHKDECERLEQQMDRANVLNDFPFTFSQESTVQVCEKLETRCSFLIKQGIHRAGMWMYECHCGESVASLNHPRLIESWNLPSILCPCKGPSSPLTKQLNSWGDYYEWRGIPLQSPAALLLHWPLTLYQAFQLSASRSLSCETYTRLHIHYLASLDNYLQSLYMLKSLFDMHLIKKGLIKSSLNLLSLGSCKLFFQKYNCI